MSQKLERVLIIGLLLTIVFAALAHGVVEPWSAALFQLLVAGLAVCWALKAYVDRAWIVETPDIAWPLAGLILVGLGQSLSWRDAEGFRRSLSLDVDATRGTVMMLLCLLVCMLLAATFLARRELLLVFARFLTVYGMVLAVFALIQNFSGTRDIYWLRTITTNVPFGPFINRDHFAGYAELLLGVPVGLIVTREVRGEQRLLYGATAMVMGVAAVFTLSRGGMVSLLAELLLLAVVSLARGRRGLQGKWGRSRVRYPWALETAAIGAIFAAILAGVVWIGAEPVINRLASASPEEFDPSKRQSFYEARGRLWQETWRVFRAHPLTGTGLGAYETAYPIYSGDKGLGGVVAQAHNDYLQILADAGILGGALALAFLVLLARAWLRVVLHADTLISGVALGCGAGVFGLLVHSLFDFGLQLPSHAVLFMVLSAVVARLGATAENPGYQHAPIANANPALFGQGA